MVKKIIIGNVYISTGISSKYNPIVTSVSIGNESINDMLTEFEGREVKITVEDLSPIEIDYDWHAIHHCDHDAEYCKDHAGKKGCNIKDAINTKKEGFEVE